MNELNPVVQSDGAEASGTKVGRFLANRGVIIIKEIKEIGTLKCDYGSKIRVATVILTTAKGNARAQAKTFGVHLEILEDGNSKDTAFLDFDESEEFCSAITFIYEAAQRLGSERRDYTEAAFSTKDSIQIGFYQTTEGQQQAFIKLGLRGNSSFFQIASIQSFRNLIDAARTHLISEGADQV
ncbi:MAG: hypothetical protein NTW86_32705 [Candidatus Sumerlaeota bacterium]|nr:hypothetical protein [Candidatus Sumerlaeota bacterium]